VIGFLLSLFLFWLGFLIVYMTVMGLVGFLAAKYWRWGLNAEPLPRKKAGPR
jgi:hypothetical protein